MNCVTHLDMVASFVDRNPRSFRNFSSMILAASKCDDERFVATYDSTRCRIRRIELDGCILCGLCGLPADGVGFRAGNWNVGGFMQDS